MILIINICKEKLHYYEFVKPIEDIVSKDFFTKHYLGLVEEDLEKAEKVIICGTSLKDNQFLEDLNNFSWIKDFDKPVLGICGGMQLIGLLFNGKINEKAEVGFFFEDFSKDFVGLSGKKEVYHLHNNYVDFSEDFVEFTDSIINQAVKHKEKEIYGVLFHPEVRQKEMIEEFVNG